MPTILHPFPPLSTPSSENNLQESEESALQG